MIILNKWTKKCLLPKRLDYVKILINVTASNCVICLNARRLGSNFDEENKNKMKIFDICNYFKKDHMQIGI